MDSMPLSRAWARFKSDLPHQHAPMAARNWGHPLHSLCSYQGKLKPSIARLLVESFVPPGGKVLDPFAGVGTIPFEACLTGRAGVGLEISPSAITICRAKLHRHDSNEIQAVLNSLERHLKSGPPPAAEIAAAGEFGLNGKLKDYFHPATFSEVFLARRYFQIHPPLTTAMCLVHACLQHVLHGNRPYALSRNSHPITPYAPSGPTEYRSLMQRLRAKVARSLDVELGESFAEGTAILADCTEPWPEIVGEVDAVITSPPFFDSTRFYSANWMRLWFSGWNMDDFRTQPSRFVDERQKRGFDVYSTIFNNSLKALKTGGVLVLHLGKSRKCDMGASLAKIVPQPFVLLDHFSESVSHCESHGIRDKGTVTSHEYLVFGR